MYDSCLKYKWDNKNVIDFARKEGIEIGKLEGRLEGKLEEAQRIAREMKREGMPYAKIIQFTKLSTEEIEKL